MQFECNAYWAAAVTEMGCNNKELNSQLWYQETCRSQELPESVSQRGNFLDFSPKYSSSGQSQKLNKHKMLSFQLLE